MPRLEVLALVARKVADDLNDGWPCIGPAVQEGRVCLCPSCLAYVHASLCADSMERMLAHQPQPQKKGTKS